MARRFQDRTDAGRSLAKKLSHYADRKDVVIMGMPRGGVPVAFEVAKLLRISTGCLYRAQAWRTWSRRTGNGRYRVGYSRPQRCGNPFDAYFGGGHRCRIERERIELERRELASEDTALFQRREKKQSFRG